MLLLIDTSYEREVLMKDRKLLRQEYEDLKSKYIIEKNKHIENEKELIKIQQTVLDSVNKCTEILKLINRDNSEYLREATILIPHNLSEVPPNIQKVIHKSKIDLRLIKLTISFYEYLNEKLGILFDEHIQKEKSNEDLSFLLIPDDIILKIFEMSKRTELMKKTCKELKTLIDKEKPIIKNKLKSSEEQLLFDNISVEILNEFKITINEKFQGNFYYKKSSETFRVGKNVIREVVNILIFDKYLYINMEDRNKIYKYVNDRQFRVIRDHYLYDGEKIINMEMILYKFDDLYLPNKNIIDIKSSLLQIEFESEQLIYFNMHDRIWRVFDKNDIFYVDFYCDDDDEIYNKINKLWILSIKTKNKILSREMIKSEAGDVEDEILEYILE